MTMDGPASVPTMPPIMTVTGGIYKYLWEHEQVQIILERLREDSRRTVTADITISARPEGHIHMTRLNLLTTRGRGDVARYARERSPNHDWDAIIEQLCVLTLNHFRTGEPVVDLGEVTPPAEPIYRLRPFVVEGEATVIYGEGGIGKSYLAGFMAALVDQNFHTTTCQPMPGKVLYLDFETTTDIAARRFQALTRGFGFGGKSTVIYRFCHQSLPADIGEIQRIVAEHDVELIVVDSAGPACGGDPESAASAITYFTALRSLRKSSITIAHRSKGGSVGPFGSVYWVNYPRMAYELKKSQEEESDVMHVALIHRKVNDGRLQRPVSFKIQWHESGAVTVAQEELADVPDFVVELPIADQCAVAFREHGPKTVKEISEITGQQVRSLSVVLSRNRTRFRRIGNQQWDNLEG
mgnify:CR=1 FL=1